MSEIGSTLRIGRRVVVTGMAGAGKSTLVGLLLRFGLGVLTLLAGLAILCLQL